MQDFKWGLQSGKVFMSEEEVDFLVSLYNSNKGVGYRAFLSDIRGKLN